MILQPGSSQNQALCGGWSSLVFFVGPIVDSPLSAPILVKWAARQAKPQL